MVFQTQAGNCSSAFAIFSTESKFQTVEIFEPRFRNLDARKFENRNIYGTKISQITVIYCWLAYGRPGIETQFYLVSVNAVLTEMHRLSCSVTYVLIC